MYERKIEELTERGRRAETQKEALAVQLEIANIVSSGLMRCTQPITDISAVPVVATLEYFVRVLRERIAAEDENFEERLASYRASVTATVTSVKLPEDEEDQE